MVTYNGHEIDIFYNDGKVTALRIYEDLGTKRAITLEVMGITASSIAMHVYNWPSTFYGASKYYATKNEILRSEYYNLMQWLASGLRP